MTMYRVDTTILKGRSTNQDSYETEHPSIELVFDEWLHTYDFRGANYITMEIQTKAVKYGTS